jgi:4-diphosphocytidyl-2-C-methyl-D-erythritol kinase
VPFFLTGGTALGTGTGTEITPLDDIALENILIVTPGVALSTAEGYKALNAPALTKMERPVKLFVSRAGAEIPDLLRGFLFQNDFEPVVFRLRPEIERAKNALLREGARPCMLSGSGSSVFGIFDSSEKRARAGDALKSEVGWQVFLCRSLSRVEYRQAFGACAALL